jgi:hypothetical protein
MSRKKIITLTIEITGPESSVYYTYAELLNNIQYEKIPVKTNKVSINEFKISKEKQ